MKRMLAIAMIALTLSACDSHNQVSQQPTMQPTARMVEQCGKNPANGEPTCVMVPETVMAQHVGSTDNSWLWGAGGMAAGYMLGNMHRNSHGMAVYDYHPPMSSSTNVSKTTIINNYGSHPVATGVSPTPTSSPAVATPVATAKPALVTQKANGQPTALFTPNVQRAPTGGTSSGISLTKTASAAPVRTTSGDKPRALFSGSSSSRSSSSFSSSRRR